MILNTTPSAVGTAEDEPGVEGGEPGVEGVELGVELGAEVVVAVSKKREEA